MFSFCWLIKISDLDFCSLIPLFNLLPDEEKIQCEKFVRPIDKIRACISRILQRIICCVATGKKILSEISIKRSKFGKPELVNENNDSNDSNDTSGQCNFNVSHHGDWLMIFANIDFSSPPFPLIGCDIVRVDFRSDSGVSVAEYLNSFSDILSAEEKNFLDKIISPTEKLEAFYEFWSIKEAAVKAIGLGLSFDLKFVDCSSVGKIRWKSETEWKNFDWKIKTFQIDQKHKAAIVKASDKFVDNINNNNSNTDTEQRRKQNSVAWMRNAGKKFEMRETFLSSLSASSSSSPSPSPALSSEFWFSDSGDFPCVRLIDFGRFI